MTTSDNEAKLREIFADALLLPASEVHDGLQYRGVEAWDSISHMMLVMKIEEEFGFMLSTDEILGLSSFAAARELLGRHGIPC